ncbi:SDR family NAD(P)-dependent oxidoreductase [Ruegeria atlantica]|uniref:SDR family NAD(P)-dependent oxidoreductase n=1 Tax=Ruegeria atlantica TaxID=81569 RepID=UPI00147D19E6|nr:SDR family oxidoreductase [Ruegeria atlantica]
MSAAVAKTAFVTGGTSGIGKAVVTELTKAGWNVSFSGRNAKRGYEVEQETGARFIQADAKDRRAQDFAIARVFDHFDGAPELFVSCAGLVFEEPLSLTSDTAFREVMEVNLTSVFRYSRAFFEGMKERGRGNIIHVVSDSALIGIHHLPAYSISKAGLLTLSEVLAGEAIESGVRVNAICPGATHPGVQATIEGYEHHAENDARWGAAPSGRHNQPQDIADTVMLLLSEKANRWAGVTLRIDGGASAAMRGGTRA